VLSDTTAPLSRRPSDFEFGKLRKIELELWSFFMGISKEEGSTLCYTQFTFTFTAPTYPVATRFVCDRAVPLRRLQAFRVSNEPVLMVPDEHELQGQIYGVGEPLPSQL
jgi:hypothetical protein